MFPQFKKINNESGIVLFIILMVAIIIMIVSVGILTQSMNETNSSQQQIDQIVSEQLAKGVFWNAYSKAYSSGSVTNLTNIGISTVLQGRNYQISVNYQGVSGNSTVWGSTANYDTFN